MRGAIAALIPKARFTRRDRYSTLAYAGGKKLSRMPSRSAVVSFSVDSVYAIAELIGAERADVPRSQEWLNNLEEERRTTILQYKTGFAGNPGIPAGHDPVFGAGGYEGRSLDSVISSF